MHAGKHGEKGCEREKAAEEEEEDVFPMLVEVWYCGQQWERCACEAALFLVLLLLAEISLLCWYGGERDGERG